MQWSWNLTYSKRLKYTFPFTLKLIETIYELVSGKWFANKRNMYTITAGKKSPKELRNNSNAALVMRDKETGQIEMVMNGRS